MVLVVKNPPANAEDMREVGSIPGLERFPGEGNGNIVFLPGKSHGQQSLVGYSPWGHKESDATEHLRMEHIICRKNTNYYNLFC